jgi:hypothetical protein
VNAEDLRAFADLEMQQSWSRQQKGSKMQPALSTTSLLTGFSFGQERLKRVQPSQVVAHFALGDLLIVRAQCLRK